MNARSLQSVDPHGMRASRWGLAALAALTLCCAAVARPALADDVTNWNAIADAAINAGVTTGPPARSRLMAMTQIAVHDALNAIRPRYASYTGIGGARAGASPEAAVATAAYVVVSRSLPSQADQLRLVYLNRVAELPDCASSIQTASKMVLRPAKWQRRRLSRFARVMGPRRRTCRTCYCRDRASTSRRRLA